MQTKPFDRGAQCLLSFLIALLLLVGDCQGSTPGGGSSVTCETGQECVDCQVVLKSLLGSSDLVDFVIDCHHFHPTDQKANQYMPLLRKLLAESVSAITPQHILSVLLDYHTAHNATATPSLTALLPEARVEVRCGALWATQTVGPHVSLPAWKKMERLAQFINTLRVNVVARRQKEKQSVEGDSVSGVRVVVVGAGPVGLLSAIQAYMSGADEVVVFEKRSNYTRDIWFDLYGAPFSRGLATLKLLGWDALSPYIEHILEEPEGQVHGITIRASVLERFLSKVASIIGIPLHYGFEFVGHCGATTRLRPIGAFRNLSMGMNAMEPLNCATVNENSSFHLFEFDILIGADGASSVTRKHFNVSFPMQESFILPPKLNITVPGLHQATLLVNFKPRLECSSSANRENDYNCCPSVKKDRGYDYPGFVVSGVTSVFKRFYFSHCQMQILFTNQLGAELMGKEKVENEEKNAEENEKEEARVPWDKVKEIVGVVFEKPFRTVKAMQKQVAMKKDGKTFDVEFFPVVIAKADRTTIVIHPPEEEKDEKKEGTRKEQEREKEGTGREKERRGGIVVIVGDASVTAHYRLGVGINNAFSSLAEIEDLVISLRQHYLKEGNSKEKEEAKARKEKQQGLAKIAELERIAKHKEEQAQERIDRMVQFQLSTIFYESYCDFGVLFDQEATDMFDSQLVYRKDRSIRDYKPDRPLTVKEMLKYCPLLSQAKR